MYTRYKLDLATTLIARSAITIDPAAAAFDFDGVDAAILEDVDAQLLAERMLGVPLDLTDDCFVSTVH